MSWSTFIKAVVSKNIHELKQGHDGTASTRLRYRLQTGSRMSILTLRADESAGEVAGVPVAAMYRAHLVQVPRVIETTPLCAKTRPF